MAAEIKSRLFCRIRGCGKVKFRLWLLRVKRTDKVDKIDVVGRPHLSGIPCQSACPKNAAGTGMRADSDGGQAGLDEIDFIDFIDRPAGSTLSIRSISSKTGWPGQSCHPCPKNAAGSGMKANAHGFNS